MKTRLFAILPFVLLAFACSPVEEMTDGPRAEISVSLTGFTKTTLGPSDGSSRKVFWSDGDRICINGTVSDALSGVPAESSSATFSFSSAPSAPYSLLYPASFYKNSNTVTLPATQTYAAGSFTTGTEPLVGYAASAGDPVTMKHLCSVVQLKIKKHPDVSLGTIKKITFRGNAGEQITGNFTVTYSAATLTATSSAEADKVLQYNLSQSLSVSSALEVYLVVPARTYASGFTVVIEDDTQRIMTMTKPSAATLTAGKIVKMSEFAFMPDNYGMPEGCNVTGRVVDNANHPIEGVVVSDGIQSVKTGENGRFYMASELDGVRFVFVSTPSGYLPQVVKGIPKFYKAKADATLSGGIYDFGDYVLTPVENPNRYTLLITADPQPRKYSKWNNDRIAYKSLDVCADLYSELADVASGISGRQVYGICLGDIVHEDMSLFDEYDKALAKLGYPTYNVIGNHDNEYSATDDDGAGAVYESHYGPRNYSFNIGGIHFVMLDNLIMKDNGSGKLSSFDQGLTDEIWAWLQSDLAFIPTTSKLMVCAHSPMFRLINSNERTNTANHGPDYGGLINKYSEIHAWAGHTHVGFNYIYPTNHRHKRVQVHTLARSTGELWTNEYLASGTPRGFTIVEVDNGTVTWRFHPLTRQTGAFVGVTSKICSAGPPAYTWRDWNYNGSGVAVMKNGGGALDEEYQLHAYPRGSYGDNYVYANVFLWDTKWQNPVWTPDGGAPVTMELVTSDTRHDLATTEFKSHYKPNVGFFKNDDGYPASETGTIATLFRAPANATPSSGTVSVTDRFGNVYTRSVSW